jgi:hypothetical protein
MPDPITNQLINNVWDAIQDAVTDGLAMTVPYGVPRPALDTVAVVSIENLSNVMNWDPAEIPDAPAQVRVEQSGDAFDIMHHFDLSYHDLRSPDTDAIKQWATSARQFELSLALHSYAQHAARLPCTAGQLDEANLGGWGQLRCVVLGSAGWATIAEKWEKADLERTVKLDAEPVNGVQALVFRTAGGPYVRRPADLSLGWTPVPGCGAELLLTEQLEFVNVQASTVIGVEMTPPGR